MDKFLAAIVYVLFKALGLLPLSVLQGIGTSLGLLASVLPGSYKKEAFKNLRIAYPDATPSMDRAAMVQLLQMFLELPYLWAPRNALSLLYIQAQSGSHLQRAENEVAKNLHKLDSCNPRFEAGSSKSIRG